MRNVRATHEPRTSHTRVMHGLIYAPHGPIGMVVHASVHNHSRRTHGPVCPARCSYVRLTDPEECSDWLLRSRGKNIVDTRVKPVEIPSTM